MKTPRRMDFSGQRLRDTDPSGRAIYNATTDRPTGQVVDDAYSSPTVRTNLENNPNVVYVVKNGSTEGLCGGEDGGRTTFEMDSKTGKLYIETTIDTNLLKDPEAVKQMTYLELGRAVQISQSPNAIAAEIQETGDFHTRLPEAQDLGKKIQQEVEKAKGAYIGGIPDRATGTVPTSDG